LSKNNKILFVRIALKEYYERFTLKEKRHGK